jgi:hypothetical protein
MRPPVAVVLLAGIALAGCVLAGCGGERRPPRAGTVAAYAGSTNRLCADLVGALRRAFEDALRDPDAAMARYAREVGAAGARFAGVGAPPSLARFASETTRHVAREAALLRRAAARSAAGDADAAVGALARHGRLLPQRIPGPVLRRAPACGGVAAVPASPPPAGEAVVARASLPAQPAMPASRSGCPATRPIRGRVSRRRGRSAGRGVRGGPRCRVRCAGRWGQTTPRRARPC